MQAAPSPQALSAVLAGLGEVGGSEDAELVAPFLSDERTPVRAAALRSVARLDFERYQPVVVRALTDERAGQSRAARDVLRGRLVVVGVDALRAALRERAPMHAKVNALALSDRVGKWDCLSLLLEAAVAAEPELRRTASHCLRAWVARSNRSFVAPTPRELGDVAASLDRSRSALDPAIAAELSAVLRGWSRPTGG